ncbi:MAG: DNA mismatch repair protein MutS [Gammaproteobacteria bacterium]|nr:DNA mismatch repair protein MutS [Gammaproteobacteria bacterium]
MNDDQDKDKVNDDDLFRQAMSDVKPLKPDNRVRHRPAPRKAPGRRDEDDDFADDGFSTDPAGQKCPEQLSFVRPGGAQKSVLKKLRNGQLTIDSTLDLHGLTVEQARQHLVQFMHESRQFGYRHVIIIHGKGFRSEEKPVIKPMVNRWLREADDVLAFYSARPKHGGTGAVYVLLRRAKE